MGRTAARSTVTFVASAATLVAVLIALAPAGGRSSSLLTAVPVAVAAVAAAAAVTGRRSSGDPVAAWRSGLAGAVAVVVVGAAWSLATASHGTAGVAAALAQLPVQAGAALLVLTAAAALAARAGRPARSGRLRRTVGAVLAAAVVGAGLTVPAQTAAGAALPPATAAPCTAGAEQRSYSVAAATVDLPFNRWGKTLPSARIFVLEQDLAATKNWSTPINRALPADAAENRRLRPRPLVLRANEGECVKVTLTNKLSSGSAHGLPANPRVGIQATGMVVDVARSGGVQVGFDADSTDPTVAIGQSVDYYWKVPAQEGLFLFQDMATPAGGEHDGGSRGVGLYGAIAVEPAGSVWKDPRSGAILSGNGSPTSVYTAAAKQSGELYVEADIYPPGAPAFRESVQLAQDEISGIGMGFNYGSEPMEDREARACPDCLGEETWLSSWPYGDPALIKLASGPGPWLPTGDGVKANQESEDCGLPESCFVSNVFHSYTGDPTKIRFGLSGVKETHVFHLHAHQWLADARDNAVTGDGPDAKPESSTIDSQSYGPGEAYTADLLYGSGSQNKTFGDSIFHCHLYPHFAEGFWALLRVHDVALDGTTATPDGVNVRPLKPLTGGPVPPPATADNPGFPGMIPGTFGWRAPQPPGSITEAGADGTERPAPRLVAGKAIDATKLAAEKAVMALRNGGDAAKAPAGAPYANPCPSGARVVDYDVTVLQRDLVYNEAGHHDPQARFMVLTKDVPAILAGTKKAEPLFIRVNAGDCIDFSLTNMAPNWTGGDAFQQLTQTNMAGGHIHLVKFDVTASDGGSNGWNYQQAAFTKDQAALTAQQASGGVTCTAGAQFYGGESTGCRIPQLASWTPPADSSGMVGQTIHERWFADYELRTVFTHDHHFAALVQNHGQFGALIVEPRGFDVRDPKTGAFLQPINSSANGTPCGTRCVGTAVGEQVDVVGPGANDDYREAGIAIADFVPLVKKGGNPKNPADVVEAPGAPEHYPSADPGTFAINYRNAPLSERKTFNGQAVDPAHRFSSYVFGDPMTPLLQGYARDNIKLRVIQGSQEEQHLFQVHGLRWREEPDDTGSPLVSAQTIGISEAFNAELPGFDCSSTATPCRGDYLYGGTSIDDLWNGMWGIMRVHGKAVAGVRSLPDNPATGTGTALPAPKSLLAPPRAATPGITCPSTAPVKAYNVVAMQKDLVYNEFGDHDPQGLLYVLAEDEAAVRSGAKKAEPLVIRANAGDCVKVSLKNALTSTYGTYVNGVDGDPAMVLEPAAGTKMGTRVSMHPQLLRHDVRLSDGAAVGFNPDSTAGINQTVSYEWFADTELGATNILDYGDVRGHRQHGLAAALVVEPQGASYHDPATGAAIRSGAAADIRVPGEEDFREMTLVYQDGLNLRTPSGAQVQDKQLPPDPEDVEAGITEEELEDAGEKGVNYTSAPLHRRLGAAPGAIATGASSTQWALAFSSEFYGDPATPIARAYEGDQLRMRVLGGNRPRQMGFALDGASWRSEPNDTRSDVVGVQGGIGTGKAVNAHVRLPKAGDHLWSSPTSASLPDGVWGLARVYPKPADAAGFTPAARLAKDNPFTAGNTPLQPLERTSASIAVFTDTDSDGVRDAGETGRSGVSVRLLTTSGTQVLATTTAADGTASFSPAKGTYAVEVVAPAGTAVVGGAQRTVDLSADGARVDLAVGIGTATAPTTPTPTPTPTGDVTPPPAPVLSKGSAQLTLAEAITVTSPEAGATLRYTLDGTVPTATGGIQYTAAVRVSADRTLTAVAVDAAGNVSKPTVAVYDLPWTGKVAALAPSAWAVTSGGTPRGGVAETTADDGKLLAVGSVAVSGRPTVDVTATVAVPADMRAAQGMTLTARVATTLPNTRVRTQWYDVSTSTWRALTTSTQGLTEARIDVDPAAAVKLVDTAGNVKLRFIADNGQPFDLQLDQVTFTAVNKS
ncbi:SdrD B-like domain-containing protein [Cellulomonas aerilata]|uniref:SdrD B-like domain-containing protein n=1 Tax=Cellulomonas aerilata TaxID=515326 RepID=UPI0011BF790B|nr:SdrD B-like domain-containing protein [Cellulomonas aerilata]